MNLQFVKNTFFPKSLKRNSQQPKGKVGEMGCDIPEETPMREATEALKKILRRKARSVSDSQMSCDRIHASVAMIASGR